MPNVDRKAVSLLHEIVLGKHALPFGPLKSLRLYEIHFIRFSTFPLLTVIM